MRKVILFLLVGLVAATGALAQSIPTATVTGKVTADGGALPGVMVTAKSERLQGPRATVTDANGAYLIPFLPPGQYAVTFAMSGMQTHQENLTLTGDMTDTVNVDLKLAAVEGEIVVTVRKWLEAEMDVPQSLTVPSPPPVTSQRSSDEKATQRAWFLCPARRRSWRPVAVSQSLTVLS